MPNENSLLPEEKILKVKKYIDKYKLYFFLLISL